MGSWGRDSTAEAEGMGYARLFLVLKPERFMAGNDGSGLLGPDLAVRLCEDIDSKLTCTCAYEQLPCRVQGRREGRCLSPGGEGQG